MALFHLTPLFAASALSFAIKKATPEGKATMSALLILSLFSWTIIITKARQLMIARNGTKKFMAAYASTRDPMDIKRRGEEFAGAPAYELYIRGADELDYHLKNNPVQIKTVKPVNDDPALGHGNTDHIARTVTTRVSVASFDAVKVVMEEAAGAEAMGLEKGMIVLSTAVAGGPFIGLLGTVWGVMETFAGIATAGGASITAMAPGVAGALICTVIGLLVAIPAMFSYNFMVTTIRAITHELDGFAARYANQIEHRYVDHRTLSEEINEANEVLATRIAGALTPNGTPAARSRPFPPPDSRRPAMKKCSSSAHHTMSELNITPLLDLAFVLLVIFIITTTPLANDIDLKLPEAAKHQKDPPHKANYITVQADGKIWLNKAELPDLASLQEQLVALRIEDQDLSVIVRGDSTTKYRQIRGVMDVIQQANVSKVDLATEAADKKN